MRHRLGLLPALATVALLPMVGCESTAPSEPALGDLPPAPASRADDTFEARQLRFAAYRAQFEDNLPALYRAATRVDTTDGIQEFEAWVLAQSYLQAWIDPSALIIEMKEDPVDWIAENMSSETEGAGPTIRVNKNNGSVRRQGSLQLVYPESFRDQL